ncbi:Panacea domain-containing protein [Bradyrhizobium iriomotense]|uniref:Panacea domain-containing protein n=1 Tax=Bradyrhizobium iriomotense TaxID=441950 RepID=UPI0032DFAD38
MLDLTKLLKNHDESIILHLMSATSQVYSSRSIANYLLEQCGARGGLDPLQTIKLTYIAHGFHLGFYDDPLIEDDVEAWKYGPVVRPVYSMVPYGSSKVTQPITFERPNLSPRDKGLVDAIIQNYAGLSGLYLSSLTHRPGTPWAITWERFGQNAVIPRELIRDHYKRVIAGGSAAVGTLGL